MVVLSEHLTQSREARVLAPSTHLVGNVEQPSYSPEEGKERESKRMSNVEQPSYSPEEGKERERVCASKRMSSVEQPCRYTAQL